VFHHRFGAALPVALIFVLATTAAPATAASQSPYTATFPQEQTVQRTCSPGAPPLAFCFTGSDHSGLGTSTPPSSSATEDFAGFVDFSSPIPNASRTTMW
jgi:hypothetical protein